MNYPKESSPNICEFDMPISTKSVFWDSFGCPITPKYRTIDVKQDTKAIKVTGNPIENVSGFKELTNINSFNTSNDFHQDANFNSNSNTISEKPERNPNKDTQTFTNPIEHREIPLLDRLGQGCLSEPTLALAKDRGDNVGVSEDCREENTSSQNIDNRNSSLSTRNRNIEGCIFIKNAENIYKSVIKLKKLQKDEKNAFKNNFPRFDKMLSSSKSKNLLEKNLLEKDNLKFKNGDMGDFDIAIYLTGLMAADPKFQSQTTGLESRGKGEYKAQRGKIMMEKKQSDGINNATFKKNNEIMNQAYTNRSKLQKAKKRTKSRNSRRKSRLTYEINKPNIQINFSGDDDSGVEYELDESGAIITKRKATKVSDTSYSNVRNSVKPSESGSTHVSYTSRKSGSKLKFVSQSILSRYSDVYGISKSKITEEEMWEAFEMIFKNYASSNRHSGEVITRRISTEWMKNAGVVNEILTQKEADDAFRSVAGTKITMNPQEYKNFLINLSLKMRLPYYELYRRMCGM